MDEADVQHEAQIARRGSAAEVLLAFLRLGLTSFGGPVAHLGYFRAEFVGRRRWLGEAEFADLVALCQFLPGPASSQVCISLGLMRARLPGAACAWIGFTLPSAIAMALFAYGVSALGDVSQAAWLKGLKLVAVAVVAQAVWNMARNLCPDRPRATMAVIAACVVFALPPAAGQIGAIVLGAVFGLAVLGRQDVAATNVARLRLPIASSPVVAVVSFAVFLALLLFLSPIAAATGNHMLRLIAAFYRSGALVFGGGHVMLPLLQSSVVPPGWISNDAFLAGYGAAQAVPGPLSTFAAYLGVAMQPAPHGWLGGAIALLAIYLPSFLLLAAALPFWNALRHKPAMQAALRGINAAVVGVLLAALYTPVWTSAVHDAADFAVALAAFLLLSVWSVAPWLVVLLGAAASAALGGWGIGL